MQDCSTCEFTNNIFKFISFLVSDQNTCHCYADLKPFHCEEEEGVDLIQVMCLNKAQCSKIRKKCNKIKAERLKSMLIDFLKEKAPLLI